VSFDQLADVLRASKAEVEPSPTVETPFRGLAYLGKIALVGSDRIVGKSQEPVRWVWQDIAVAGTIVLLAGTPSGGKTTLLSLILAARTNLGKPIELLGRRVDPAPVGQYALLIEGEHGEASACRKFRRGYEIAGVDTGGLDRLILVARKGVRLHSPEWGDIQQMVKAGLVSDIAIDTVARVAGGDANSEQEQVAIFDVVANTIELAPPERAPTVWAVAHTRKGDPAGLDDVSGSTQRVGQADSVLLVKGEKIDGRTASTTVTFAKLREEPDVYPASTTYTIELERDGGRRMRVVGASPKDGHPLEVQLTDILRAGPQTKNAIRQILKARGKERSGADLEAAVSSLFAARAITTAEVTVRGKAQKALALRTDNAMRMSGRWPDSGLEQ
jgi:hypothetical protein